MIDVTLIIATLNHFHPLSKGVQEFLRHSAIPCSFQKGELLLKEGDICEHIYFINKGVIRGFVQEGKKDITTWITAEHELVTSIYGLENNEPATENIQALENCQLLALTNEDVQTLYERFPEFNITIRKLLQQYYKDAEGRAFVARLTNAENKYKYFLKRYRHLANRVPLKYIASFLGMTLETLSRTRSKMSNSRSGSVFN
jgi:CRP-like cAMP-binding protein